MQEQHTVISVKELCELQELIGHANDKMDRIFDGICYCCHDGSIDQDLKSMLLDELDAMF